MRTVKLILLLAIVLISSRVVAQREHLAPRAIPGVAVYIPFPVAIKVDGILSDWTGVEVITVTRGPQKSTDPAENGSFTFAVAADADHFYITMSMRDKTIITGQHGADYWNEDSLEFYLNLTSNRFAKSYQQGVFQIRIIPGDIGKTDATALTVTGTSADAISVTGVVFKTAEGWGFEASVPLTGYIRPAHGLEIGFQAQANGASEKDRNVKLIWSHRDLEDQSWQDPSRFGAGLFFEVGQTIIPVPSTESTTSVSKIVRKVAVNQVGYFPSSTKMGVLSSDKGTPQRTTARWEVLDANKNKVAEGTTTEGKLDEASGDVVQLVDFSLVTKPGIYTLVVDGVESVPFEISPMLYNQLKIDVVRYFYLNRSGFELEKKYAGDQARAAGHLSDKEVTCYKGRDADNREWPGCDYTLDASGGWYDAGDYGKYVVNGGISVWTLLNLYERFPQAFPDGALNIPESGNGVSDLLDEVRWEMDFLLRMQVPDGKALAGMAHHKLHDEKWSNVPTIPPTEYNNDSQHLDPDAGRYLFPPSTAATLNLAAVAAQCARIWRDIDADFAARCLKAGEKAWEAARSNPVMLAGNTPGAGGGPYADGYIDDEFYWAAAELYVTTGKNVYREFVEKSRFYKAFPGPLNGASTSMTWFDTAAPGTISLAMVKNGLPDNEIAALRKQIIATADRYLGTMANEGYRVPFTANNYYYGSNSMVLNNAIILALAHDFTKEGRYLEGVRQCMDYILGMNAVGQSFISGYGEVAMQHPHHRFWGNQPGGKFPPPPPGAMAAGPLGNPIENATRRNANMDAGPAKRYADDIGAYSSNEVAINWNSPLVWVVTYLVHQP